MDETRKTALELSAVLKRGEMSREDMLKSAMQDALHVNESSKAFSYLFSIPELESLAEEVDVSSECAFTGATTAFKALHAWTRLPMNSGLSWRGDYSPSYSEAALVSLLECGWMPLGMTAVPEFGYPFWTMNTHQGAVTNPFSADLSAGGSSGGAACAVAAGVIPVAQASDGGGSIRVPASMCGIFGFKPSRGLVSQLPAATSVAGYATHGVLSRTVDDAVVMLDCYPRARAYEPFALANPPRSSTWELVMGDRGLRVGVFTENMMQQSPTDEVTSVLEDVCLSLEALGHNVIWVTNPFDGSFATDMLTTHRAGQQNLRKIVREKFDDVSDFSRWLADWSEGVTLDDYLDAVRRLRGYTLRVHELMESIDILLSPTLSMAPVSNSWFESEGVDNALTRMFQLAPYSAPFNVTGQPSASLPITGPSPPAIGVQLTGRVGEDNLVLSLSKQLEGVFNWCADFPSLWRQLYRA